MHSALVWGNKELGHHSIPVTNHLAHGGGSCLPSHRLSSIVAWSNTNGWKGSWMPPCIIPVYSPLLHFSYHLVLDAISASINLVNWASAGKLTLKIDFFFFNQNAFSCSSFSCECPSSWCEAVTVPNHKCKEKIPLRSLPLHIIFFLHFDMIPNRAESQFHACASLPEQLSN